MIGSAKFSQIHNKDIFKSNYSAHAEKCRLKINFNNINQTNKTL